MTLFEYLAIAFSLLYSLAALRLVGGLPAALERGRRYPPHFGLCLLLLFAVTISFWAFWSLRDVDWTFPGFVAALAIPGMLYYCAAVLIPENPADVVSWRNHYYEVHTSVYSGIALWSLAAAVSATVNLTMGFTHPARLVQVTAFSIGLVGALSSSRRVHGVIVGLMVFLMVATFAMQLGPDWLSRG